MRALMKDARARYDTHVAKNTLSTGAPSSTLSGVVQPTPPDMNIEDPSKCYGKQNDCGRWLFECKNVINVGTRIDTEEKRIRGEGAIYTYQHFLTAFESTFKDPLEKQTNRVLNFE
ncbi:hypothetical protein SeMB42_g07346 [Synchytrium endobioticum]|nr:hypothetical protein SeMB42_g07346 [Synchytrium endobioticum]